ncbi:cystathionine gamma-lyase [Nitritalea halalkaliphila LW7]|uniref:Cystathionine gamma-lyase n=1 Tax=Nitritalea halalkaliphila LW7 TaxID=1189621 RepID=I5CA62_9BACT|nr:aminotransferase class I/II-fold pyridoxal phosphate-dependent enzyme [Nitritalea halalkaliphila]EIM78714.1 cystathionine gamma-lyase [Nitritalea halalkaliphila LW7]
MPLRPETIAIHAGNEHVAGEHPVIQPITLSTTFRHEAGALLYSRTENPNRRALEKVLAQLESGVEAACFSSGNAAGMAVFQALPAGSHVLAPDDMYHGLRLQLKNLFAGVLEVDFVDMCDLEAVRAAFRPETALVWVETPSNPLLKISDIAGISQLCKEKKVVLACDNTFASPIFQQPLLLGADLVMHSSTKFIGGHSDLTGGVVVSAEKSPLWEKIRTIQQVGGAVPSPFDCYFLTRSIKTLPYRMRAHAANAMLIARFLEDAPSISRVYYPGLESHPQHPLAARQMRAFGSMLSFLFEGDAQQTDAFIEGLQLFTNATSLGGVETLIERRAAVEGPDTKTPENLIRLSVGLEHPEDLIADLIQAITTIPLRIKN